ncbi:MAG: VOC family protein [Bacteroidota bacterium]
MDNDQPRVTGIGGIFFKSENPEEMKAWYQKNLGLGTDQWGTNFEWYQGRDPTKKGFTQWSPSSKKSTHFEPSPKEFMINYRVVHLEQLLEKLKQNGVTVLDKIETFEYGKFVHILDNEGNKIELWEPDDVAYEKLVEGRTK